MKINKKREYDEIKKEGPKRLKINLELNEAMKDAEKKKRSKI
jgi:hypothetical protein